MAQRIVFSLLIVTGVLALGSGLALLLTEPAPTPPEHEQARHAINPRSDNQADPAEPDPGLAGVRLGEFDLIDHNGQSVDESIIEGRYSVVDFVFSNCPVICPAMTDAVARVQDRLQGVEGVGFVSFSLDVERDTPERLRQWAQQHDADTGTWTFVTGQGPSDQAQIDRLLGSVPGFRVERDSEQLIPLKSGTGEMPNIVHPVHLMLVGPDRRVLGLYPFSMPGQLDNLADRLRRLAQR